MLFLGIGIGILVLLAAAVLLIVLLDRKKKRKAAPAGKPPGESTVELPPVQEVYEELYQVTGFRVVEDITYLGTETGVMELV